MKKNETPAETPAAGAVPTEKLSVEAFTLHAIKTLRKPDKKGLHTVWSGFNLGFRKYFPDLDPVAETKRLVEEGKIGMHLARGGAVIYLPSEAPSQNTSADQVLKKMGVNPT